MSDAKVSVEKIVRRMDGQIGMLEREALILRFAGAANLVLEWMIPARDYILATQSEIATIRAAVEARDDETAGDAVARVLLDRRAEIAEMRAVLGRKCRCGHFEIQHRGVQAGSGFVCGIWHCAAKCIAFEPAETEYGDGKS